MLPYVERVFVYMTRLGILRWEGYPGLSGWPLNGIISVPVRRRDLTQKRRQSDNDSRYWSCIDTGQGMLVANRSWKRQGRDSRLTTLERVCWMLNLHLISAQCNAWFWNSDLQKWMCVVLSHQLSAAVNCYSR